MWRWLWLALVLTAQVVSARPTTFAWDNGANWPTGTTVELCSNGVCASGITGNQHTLDVPIQPGERFDARVRAYAPGYQCGDPPALCEYSAWATLAQTWPAVPVGLWAIKEAEMALPASITLYTNWDHGTLASWEFSHEAPNIPNTFTWDASGSILQDNDAPWNGQYLFDATVNWHDGLSATVSSATVL